MVFSDREREGAYMHESEYILEVYDERPEAFRSQRRNEPHKGVRITHLESGISAAIGDGRSIIRNRELAMNILERRVRKWRNT